MPGRKLHIYQKTAVWAFILSTLPTLAINLNYLLAASEGSVPWCLPYWDSCTSISATGRQGLAYYFFKLTMLPLAVVYWAYWDSAQRALQLAGDNSTVIRTLGRVAVIALAIYILALGAAGDSLQLARRIGIIFYFTFTYLCQLLIVYRQGLFRQRNITRIWQSALLFFILAIGLLTLFLDVWMANYDSIEDAFEWNIALLLHMNFLLAALAWRSLYQSTLNRPVL